MGALRAQRDTSTPPPPPPGPLPPGVTHSPVLLQLRVVGSSRLCAGMGLSWLLRDKCDMSLVHSLCICLCSYGIITIESSKIALMNNDWMQASENAAQQLNIQYF